MPDLLTTYMINDGITQHQKVKLNDAMSTSPHQPESLHTTLNQIHTSPSPALSLTFRSSITPLPSFIISAATELSSMPRPFEPTSSNKSTCPNPLNAKQNPMNKDP